MQLKSFQQIHLQSSIYITRLNVEKREILELKESLEEMELMERMELKDLRDQMAQLVTKDYKENQDQ